MKQKKLLLIACLTLIGSGSVFASDIYKYTDENGNIHYGDRPSGVQNETRVAILSRRTDNAAVQQAYQARYNNDDTGAQTGNTEVEAQEEKKLTRAERIAQAEERQATCDRYRARLETLVTARRLYRHDDDGERVYLDDAEIQDAREKAEQLVAENCN